MNRSRLILRADTTANWAAVDPVPAAQELTFDTTKQQFKAGDGTKKWSELAYLGSPPPDLTPFVKTVTLGGTRHPVDTVGNVNLNGKFFDKLDVPYAVRLAVAQGQYVNGELVGDQPGDSRIEMSFTTRTDKFVFERGYTGTLVWCRYPKR